MIKVHKSHPGAQKADPSVVGVALKNLKSIEHPAAANIGTYGAKKADGQVDGRFTLDPAKRVELN